MHRTCSMRRVSPTSRRWRSIANLRKRCALANISSYNINDVALYYHALRSIEEPLEISAAQEHVRKRLVEYLERRRAALSLPPLRTEMASLGEKALAELKQMRLISVESGQVQLLPAGATV